MKDKEKSGKFAKLTTKEGLKEEEEKGRQQSAKEGGGDEEGEEEEAIHKSHLSFFRLLVVFK